MAAFPENIACAKTGGFGETLPFMKKYLGNTVNESYRERGKGTVSVHIDSHADMNTFTQWYNTYGHDTFTINLPLFGVEKAWSVRITTPITTKPWEKNVSKRTIPMNLEVMETI